MRIPVDSAEAAELREAEAERAHAEDLERRRHDEECRDGWRGEDDEGRPRPCLVCRPWLAHRACPTCSAAYSACVVQRLGKRGPCCPHCNHDPRTTR